MIIFNLVLILFGHFVAHVVLAGNIFDFNGAMMNIF